MTIKKNIGYVSKLSVIKEIKIKIDSCFKKKQKIKASNYVKTNFSDVIRRLSFE